MLLSGAAKVKSWLVQKCQGMTVKSPHRDRSAKKAALKAQTVAALDTLYSVSLQRFVCYHLALLPQTGCSKKF